MLGLSVEKLFVVALVAAMVIGPQRLPVYTRVLAQQVRALRGLLETARQQAESDLGVSLQRTAWSDGLRAYDPRAVVGDALREPAGEPAAGQVGEPAAEQVGERLWSAEVWHQARAVRFGQRHLVVGSAAHPRRIDLAALDADDPRRVAAETGG